VDRTFVQGVAESPVDSAIVRAIIDLANAMGILAVAEGVETRDQAAELKMLGCQVAQGFYFSRPLRAQEFDELLTRHFAPTAGPTGPVLMDKGANTSSITAVAPARACPTGAFTLPG
jgi:predicted signal transduction protein with EAL and GGDEF domain